MLQNVLLCNYSHDLVSVVDHDAATVERASGLRYIKAKGGVSTFRLASRHDQPRSFSFDS
jgi:hypothetical protein